MASANRQKLFIGLFIAVFVGAMWICTGWIPGIITYASMPIIVAAETIVLGMIYASIFHGETHEEERHTIKRDIASAQSEKTLMRISK